MLFASQPCCRSPATRAAATAREARLWKWELEQLASRAGLGITTRHLPLRTGTWNGMSHRLFWYIGTKGGDSDS